ncbi:MAG: nitrogen fixation protein NifX [Sedimenticola sp.]
MTTALKVAFATSDMKHVDQHFGAAQSFAIYAVDQEKACFVEANEFGQLAMDGNEDKLAAKIEALDGCIAVYSQAVGASAIQQLKAKGIQPVKVSPGAEISELIESLQDELRQGPSSWLAKAIASTLPADPSRFDAMEEEGWEE